jgi:hypothetical protein
VPKSAEFILQPHLPSVVLVEPFGPNFGAVAETLGQDPTLQTVECVSAMDTLSIVRKMSACVILGHAASGADVTQLLVILKTLVAQVQRKRSVRMVVTVAPGLSAEFVEKLTIYGCTEVVQDSIATKALLFKLDRHLKALPKPTDAELEAVGVPRPKLVEDPAEPGPPPAAGVRLTPPIDLPGDRWCMSGGGTRREGDEWRTKLRGPSLDHGRWVGASGQRNLWQWLSSDAKGASAGGQSVKEDAKNGWFCSSERAPEFKHGLWMFVGRNPWLGFVENGVPIAHKFKISDRGSMLVARDSDAALNWLALLRNQLARRGGSIEASIATGPAAQGSGPDAQIVYVDPLRLASDFWLFEKVVPKKVAERWLIQLTGPGPAVGRWVEQKGKGSQAGAESAPNWSGTLEKWWRWVPEAGDQDPFIKELGAWFFYGLSPNFLDGRWSFASSSPELGFYYKGSCYGAKFRLLEDGALEAARDSTAAIHAYPLIRQSFERQITLRAKESPPLDAPKVKPVRPPVPPEDPRGEGSLVQTRETGPSRPDFLDPAAPARPALDAIFAPEAPGPTLSALALMFLASELIARRMGTIRDRCDRYCSYLHASFGGLRVEIWAPIPASPDGMGADSDLVQGWACVGRSDVASKQRFETVARMGAGIRDCDGEPVFVVEVRPSLQNPIAMLVVGGNGAQKIDPAYAHVVARAAVGLVLGARAELAAAPVLEELAA